MILTQNRPDPEWTDPSCRLRFYRQGIDRRIASGTVLRVPRLAGLRERLPEMPFHASPEIFFQERGRARFTFPRESFRLEPGEMALVPRGMPHGEEWSGDFANIIVMFRPEGLLWTRGYREGTRRRIVPPDSFPGPPRPAEYCDEIAESLHRGAAAGGPVVRGLLLALLGRLRETLERPEAPAAEAPAHPLLGPCRALIAAHFTRPDLSVQWIARELGCSADHLSRMYRRQTGRRLIHAIHHHRVAHARQLLGEGTYRIAEVAWACGFVTPSYFNRIFRAFTGKTPRAFRENRANAGLRAGRKPATLSPNAHHLTGQ